MVDRDGRYRYSAATKIKAIKAGGHISVFPTILSKGESFNVEITATRATTLYIAFYDASGKLVHRSTQALTTGKNQLMMEAPASLRGNVFMMVNCDEFHQTVPVVIR
jgi:hypothetical protein